MKKWKVKTKKMLANPNNNQRPTHKKRRPQSLLVLVPGTGTPLLFLIKSNCL